MSESTSQQVVQAKDLKASVHEFVGNNAGVMVKLMVFSAALLAFPIVTFFITLHSLFDGNATWAAGAAALMANVIVILYIITAYFEKPQEAKEEKKDQ